MDLTWFLAMNSKQREKATILEQEHSNLSFGGDSSTRPKFEVVQKRQIKALVRINKTSSPLCQLPRDNATQMRMAVRLRWQL